MCPVRWRAWPKNGLSDEQLRRVLVDSGTSILGLVQHLTAGEPIRAAGDPGAVVGRPIDGERLTLRWLLAHMTSEVARHAGHADILREQIDGVTGR